MKIAIYKRTGDIEYEVVGEVLDWREESVDMVRLSQPVEVEFEMLPPEEVVPQEIEALQKLKAYEHAQYLRKAATIDDQISKLQAITHQVDDHD